MAIITIFSGEGCNGEEISQLVAEQMGYNRIGESLRTETSRRFNIPIDNFRQALSGRLSLFNKFTREREKNIAGFKKVLAELLEDDNLLLHGFATHLLPSSVSHVLKVCLIASIDYRVSRLVETKGMSRSSAEKYITETDKLRNNWTTFLSDKRPYDATLYDIVIPIHETSVLDVVTLIESQAVSKPLETSPSSLKALQDFILAADVNLTLVDSGYDVDVDVKDGSALLTIHNYVTRLKQFRENITQITSGVKGIEEVSTQLGNRFNAPSINPMSRVTKPEGFLLCENEQNYAHSLSERLQAGDLKSSVVYDSQQAIDVANKEEPAVMVLDLMMPGIDGINTLRKIKEEHPDIRVIILTRKKTPEEERTARELNAYAYLEKPVNVDKMAEIMRSAYQEAGLEHAARSHKRL